MHKHRPDLKPAPMPGFDKAPAVSDRARPTEKAERPLFSDLETTATTGRATGPIPNVFFISPNRTGLTTVAHCDEDKPLQGVSPRRVRRR